MKLKSGLTLLDPSRKGGIDVRGKRRGSDRTNQAPFGTCTVSASMIEAEIAFIGGTTSTNTASCAAVGRSDAAQSVGVCTMEATTGIDRLQTGCLIVQLIGQATPITQDP